MTELEHLKSMWSTKTKRSTKLIIPQVTYKNSIGSLNNDNWFFHVPYAFREALDIKFEERKKDKKSYMVWTQGPIISFKEGDILHSKDKNQTIQIRFANQMGWDTSKEEMYQGSVVYSEYTTSNNTLIKQAEHSCTQMQFLQLLINGSYKS